VGIGVYRRTWDRVLPCIANAPSHPHRTTHPTESPLPPEARRVPTRLPPTYRGNPATSPPPLPAAPEAPAPRS